MTDDEKLQAIIARCNYLIETCSDYTPRAEAGWRSTIATIEALQYMSNPQGDHICDNAGPGCPACYRADEALSEIIEAWEGLA